MPAFQPTSAPSRLILSVHTPHSLSAIRFGLFRVRSPLLAESHFVFSSWGYLDVSVPPVSLHYAMNLRNDTYAFNVRGFPHSEIRASSDICSYTRLIAACHVLHRLPVPGHSPCALSSLTFGLAKSRLYLLAFARSMSIQLRSAIYVNPSIYRRHLSLAKSRLLVHALTNSI